MKLKHDILLSSSAFNFKLRRYIKGTLKNNNKKGGAAAADVLCDVERGECFVSDSAAAAGDLAAASKVLIVPGYGLAVSKVGRCSFTVSKPVLKPC